MGKRRKKGDAERRRENEEKRRESGEPGGGAGRRDEVGPTGVYPMSGGIPPGKHLEIRNQASWGQGERGAAGYEDSGGSELVWRDGQLLGGMTAGPGGEPTIDIHGGDVPAEWKGRSAGAPDESRTRGTGAEEPAPDESDETREPGAGAR